MDKKILQQLYADYGKEIRLYLYSLCRNWDMAEDLCQETFEKALLSLSSSHTNMRAWLYMVARNLCFNVMKREKRQLSLEEAEWEGMRDLYADKGMAKEGDVLQELIQKEQYRALYRALMELPSPKREVLLLQYFGGLRLKEIAEILQISPENARVMSSRARKEMKQRLEEEGYEI